MGTSILIPKNLRMKSLRFGIGAPPAAQRTPFKKDGGTNARAIVRTKLLYVENCTFFHISEYTLKWPKCKDISFF